MPLIHAKTIHYSSRSWLLNELKYSYIDFKLNEVDEIYRKDKEIIFKFLKNDESNFKFIDKSLKENKNFVSSLLDKHVGIFKYCDEEIKGDYNIAWKAIGFDGSNLQYLPAKFKKNKAFVRRALATVPSSFQYADLSLQDDKEMVIEAMKLNVFCLAYASERLQRDKELIAFAIKKDASIYKYIDKSFKENDKEIIILSLENNDYLVDLTESFKYKTLNIRSDETIVNEYIKYELKENTP